MTDRELLPLWVEVKNEQGNSFILDPIKEHDKIKSAKSNGLSIVPLYTAPPKKEWVGLTSADLIELIAFTSMSIEDAKSVEAKLKEKNK
jgi:hypothetical protein